MVSQIHLLIGHSIGTILWWAVWQNYNLKCLTLLVICSGGTLDYGSESYLEPANNELSWSEYPWITKWIIKIVTIQCNI